MTSSKRPGLSVLTFHASRTAIPYQALGGALGMQLYQVLYEGEEPPKTPKAQSKREEKLWGDSGREARHLDPLRRLLATMDEADRNALIAFAAQLARRSRMK